MLEKAEYVGSYPVIIVVEVMVSIKIEPVFTGDVYRVDTRFDYFMQ